LKQLGELSPDYNSNVVLLTGSTGFLGSHFLHKLTENTEIHVILIVRAKSNEEGLERVQSLYKHQHGKLLSVEQLSRIEVLCGDVAEPQFGLTNQDWQKVISSVED
ncbi:SDR family oxidoreductase, partial [Agrobacterium tumefaciens]|nr:SDR family oxidoreductase [Agrobacterium tumefaciens]